MRAEDYMDMDSARNKAIQQLAEICAAMGLNWVANDTEFMIELPKYVAMKATAQVEFTPPQTRRKTFDITTWGEPGPIEGLPDDMQLPDYGEILEEGQPPKGDVDAEA